MLGQRYGIPFADDEVVQHPHIDQGEGLLQVLGNPQVRLTRFGIPRRVVVGKDDGGRMQLQGAAYHFSGMYAGTVNSALEELFIADDTVAVVEKDAGEDLACLVV